MKEFWVRVVSVVVIVLGIFEYNSVLEAREKDEKIAQMAAWIENNKTEEEVPSDSGYKDGVYTGTGVGFRGEISVQVAVESGEIADVQILSAEKDDKAYVDRASTLTEEIIETQSTEVDTVSGATFSSQGIIDAAEEALGKAEESGE